MIEDSRILDNVPLARNRFLAVLGGTLTALASGVWFADAVRAGTLAAPPYPCYGYDECSGCRASYSCSGCSPCPNCGCHTGGQCWTACPGGSGTELYECCDHIQNGGPCICSQRVTTCA